jgi:hypothetical protein
VPVITSISVDRFYLISRDDGGGLSVIRTCREKRPCFSARLSRARCRSDDRSPAGGPVAPVLEDLAGYRDTRLAHVTVGTESSWLFRLIQPGLSQRLAPTAERAANGDGVVAILEADLCPNQSLAGGLSLLQP